jgi:hydrogenase maturation factor
MNLVYGQVVEVFFEDGILIGKICVRGAIKDAPLGLLASVTPGDWVLLCDGVAIGNSKTEMNCVSGNSR